MRDTAVTPTRPRTLSLIPRNSPVFDSGVEGRSFRKENLSIDVVGRNIGVKVNGRALTGCSNEIHEPGQ